MPISKRNRWSEEKKIFIIYILTILMSFRIIKNYWKIFISRKEPEKYINAIIKIQVRLLRSGIAVYSRMRRWVFPKDTLLIWS